MRAALTALTDELKRLKASGVKTVSISEESLARLRVVVAGRGEGREARGEGAGSQTSGARGQTAQSGSQRTE